MTNGSHKERVTLYLRRMMVIFTACGALCGVLRAGSPAFEVASIRENTIDDPQVPGYISTPDYVPSRSGKRVAMRNSLEAIVAWAYGLKHPEYELISSPRHKVLDLMYEIQAVAPDGIGEPELHKMFQSLLQDRFRLTAHREMREATIYDMVSSAKAPGLRAASTIGPKRTLGSGGSSTWVEFGANGRSNLVGRSATMEELTSIVGKKLNAPVRDRTGLLRQYDYDVAFSNGVDSDSPDFVTALQDLGLKLRKGKGQIEVLIIDSVERASDN